MPNKKIVHVSWELRDFAHTGGLGGVVNALALGQKCDGDNVSVIMPGHQCILNNEKIKKEYVCEFEVRMAERTEKCKIFRSFLTDRSGTEVPVYLVCNDTYFGPHNQIYDGIDKDPERAVFFAKAVSQAMDELQYYTSGCKQAYKFQNPDIIHAHDWSSMLVPVLERAKYNRKLERSASLAKSDLERPGLIGTIHNAEYQGRCGRDILRFLSDCVDVNKLFSLNGAEFYGAFNFLKCIKYADKATVVSENYLRQIIDTDLGCGLQGFFTKLAKKSCKLIGIGNGLDTRSFNPQTDSALGTHTYGVQNVFEGKQRNKAEIQKEHGLPQNPDAPLFSYIGRYTGQKGLEILAVAIIKYGLMDIDPNMQLIFKGIANTAEREHFDRLFQEIKKRYPKRIAIIKDFCGVLTRRIYAATDAGIIPSYFEPCGPTKEFLAYGCIPIGRKTGGIPNQMANFDTQKPKALDRGYGIRFSGCTERVNGQKITRELCMSGIRREDYMNDPYIDKEARALVEACKKAIDLYYNHRDTWIETQRKNMLADHSWKRPLAEYSRLYEALIRFIAPKRMAALKAAEEVVALER